MLVIIFILPVFDCSSRKKMKKLTFLMNSSHRKVGSSEKAGIARKIAWNNRIQKTAKLRKGWLTGKP